jgi:hypothetical protein
MKLFNEQEESTEVPYDAELLSITVDGAVIYNPCRTPDDSAFCTPERYGFEVWETGGGSVAWGLMLPNGDCLLLTDSGGCDLPEEGDEESPMMARRDYAGYDLAAIEDFAELPKNAGVNSVWPNKSTHTIRAGEWMDDKALQHCWYLDNNPIGVRVVLMEWEDKPHTAELIKGDGRTGNFEVLAAGKFPRNEGV